MKARQRRYLLPVRYSAGGRSVAVIHTTPAAPQTLFEAKPAASLVPEGRVMFMPFPSVRGIGTMPLYYRKDRDYRTRRGRRTHKSDLSVLRWCRLQKAPRSSVMKSLSRDVYRR